VGCFVTVFDEQLRDQAHMLELLRAGRYRAHEGLNSGQIRPFEERPLRAK
jgi:hypothetical protein